MNYFANNNDTSCESDGISIPERGAAAIAIALIIMLGIAGLSLVGCPDNTGGGTGSDTTAPAQITGLAQVRSADGTSVTLSWTNPADTDLETIRITVTPTLSGFPLDVPASGASMSQSEVVTGLTAGEDYTFAVLTIDAAENVSSSSTAPTVVASSDTTGAPGFTAIDAGQLHTCALRGGEAFCWGARASGRLGIGGSIGGVQATPVAVSLNDVSAISIGNSYTCAIADADDGAYCWGSERNGRLGIGGATTGTQNAPVAVLSGVSGAGTTLTGVSAISAGDSHTCVIAGDNDAAYCWGSGQEGRRGDGTTGSTQATPLAVLSGESGSGASLTSVSAISAGAGHTCAIAGANAYCWGSGLHGQLGNGATSGDQTAPVAVMGPLGTTGPLIGVTAIVAGAQHTCAIANGTAYCWGNGANGRLGSNTTADQSRPVLVVAASETGTPPTSGTDSRAPLAAVTSISINKDSNILSPSSCAVAGSTNIAYCWGTGNDSLGIGASATDQLRPAAVQGVGASGMSSGMLSGIVAIAAGAQHTCAVSPDAAYCWGLDTNGQLGNGATVTASQSSPVDVTSQF